MKDLHKINHRCLLELFSFNKGLLNGTHQSFQNFILLLIKLFVVVFPAIKLEALPSSSTIQCYECFNEKMCDESSRCKGTLCAIYENRQSNTTASFCLYSPIERRMIERLFSPKGACWLQNEGVNCLCTQEFCNPPRTLEEIHAGIPNGMKLLKRNPLVDYDYIDEEEKLSLTSTSDSRAVSGENLEKFIEKLDASSDFDFVDLKKQDLVPVDFKEYMDWSEKHENGANDRGNKVSAITQQTTSAPTGTSIVNLPNSEVERLLQRLDEEFDELKNRNARPTEGSDVGNMMAVSEPSHIKETEGPPLSSSSPTSLVPQNRLSIVAFVLIVLLVVV